MPHPVALALSVAAVSLFTACAPPVARATPPRPSAKALARLRLALVEAPSPKVLEGLPHPGAERARYAEEQAKPHQRVDGHAFYPDPIEVPQDDLARLRDALFADGALRDWEGEKKCGGFHPDFALVATTAGRGPRTLHVHLCFGCGEVLVTGPREKAAIRLDLDARTRAQLLTLTGAWRRSRPAPPRPDDPGAEPDGRPDQPGAEPDGRPD